MDPEINARLTRIEAELAKMQGWGEPVPLAQQNADLRNAIRELSNTMNESMRRLEERLAAVEGCSTAKVG